MSRNKATINQITGLVQELANKSNVNHTHTLDNLSDVTISNPSTGQILKYNGTEWVNGTDNAGSSTLQEVFVSTANQTQFSVANDITGVALVSLNGVIQKPTTDYSISGNTVTFVSPLDADSEVIITYGLQFDVASASNKQDLLVSGTNIKTINGQSVLGSGNIVISAPSTETYRLLGEAVSLYPGIQSKIGSIGIGQNLNSNANIISSSSYPFLHKFYPALHWGTTTNLGTNYYYTNSGCMFNSPFASKISAVFGITNITDTNTYISLSADGNRMSGKADYNDATSFYKQMAVGTTVGSPNLKIFGRSIQGSSISTYVDLGSDFPNAVDELYKVEYIFQSNYSGSINYFDIKVTRLKTSVSKTVRIENEVNINNVLYRVIDLNTQLFIGYRVTLINGTTSYVHMYPISMKFEGNY